MAERTGPSDPAGRPAPGGTIACARQADALMEPAVEQRRFGGVARLFGAEGAARIRRAHVAIAGVGGVGSWAAEALARSGVGTLTLIDLDHVAESNINRQVHALESTLGMAKAEAMRARIADIAPGCTVNAVDDFVTRDNVAALVPDGVDWVIDAVDQVGAKAALVAHCRACGIAVVACGAAGGRTDPLQLRQDDLAQTQGDALLAAVRADLRRRHGFPKAATGSPQAKGYARARRAAAFGVPAIYCDELAVRAGDADATSGHAGAEPAGSSDAGGRAAAGDDAAPASAPGAGGAALGCAGYGSIVTVTASMGLAAAGLVLRALAAPPRQARPAAPVNSSRS